VHATLTWTAIIFVFLLYKAFNMVLGRVIHIGVDAILVSAVLAGIKRSTGLQFKSEAIESKDIRGAVNKYLNVGDWVLDQGIAFISSSSYFERKR